MKRLIIASAAFCAAATISAQEVVESQSQPQVVSQTESQVEETPVSIATKFKPGDERFGAEAGLTLGDGFRLSGGNLVFNYTLSDEWTIRLGFGLTVDKECVKDENDNKTHSTETSFDIKPGIYYSFTGTDRLEPYVGAEVLFGLNSTCDFSHAEAPGVTVEEKEKSRSPRFGANAFTGFNFYVAKDLYLGAEVGFGFVVTPQTHTFGTKESGDYDSKDNDVKSHKTSISANCNPSIRVGWKF